ncbi:hypothetical protein [Streptomyces celluloflavus]|uniref:hypothetical protein n=1 Tax=Streptomyces celluloflavus TaxID=58344 RepID=UPI0034611869|nr:hypothetical protein OG717_29840 [Streptomyces celluloflavus]
MTHPSSFTHTHLIDEIQALLDPLRTMHRRHQDALDKHRTADGEITEEEYADYEEARQTTAIEASDTLDTVVKRLELLVAAPAHRAFTIALKGPGHAEGANPSLFVVNGTDIDDAHRRLAQLPSFRRWLADIRNPEATGPSTDADVVRDQSHAGTRAPGTYSDLRNEQARLLAASSASRPTPALPLPGPPSASLPRSR